MTDNVFLVFMIYGLIGWIWETSYVSLRERKFVNRGFLRGPFIPIYGCAVTTMIYFMQVFFGDFTGNNMKDYLLIMVFMAIIASFWEYIVSYVMEVAFSTRWWDYSSRKFNINGRISLETSIFWGFGGFFLYKYLHPFLRPAIKCQYIILFVLTWDYRISVRTRQGKIVLDRTCHKFLCQNRQNKQT